MEKNNEWKLKSMDVLPSENDEGDDEKDSINDENTT